MSEEYPMNVIFDLQSNLRSLEIERKDGLTSAKWSLGGGLLMLAIFWLMHWDRWVGVFGFVFLSVSISHFYIAWLMNTKVIIPAKRLLQMMKAI